MTKLNNIECAGWEEVPDEDLWEDGEMSKKDVKEEIFWRVVTMGDWKLIRRNKMNEDYTFHNSKLADILMTVAAIPNVDELSDDTLKEFADELRIVASLVEDLGNALTKSLDENEMLKGRITAVADRIS